MIRPGFFVLSILSLFSLSAHADIAAREAVGSVVVVGAAAGAAAVAVHGWSKFELDDWKNWETDTTAVLDQQCGMDVELRLLGNARMNLFYAGLRNVTDKSVVVRPQQVSMQFSGGRERMAYFMIPQGDAELRPGWRMVALIPFPDKFDFKDQDSITANIPILDEKGNQSCTVSAVIRREARAPQLASTYIDRSSLDVAFGFGVVPFRTGSMKSLGDAGQFAFNLTENLYPWVNSGFFLMVSIEGYGAASKPFVSSKTGLQDTSLTGVSVGLGYTYRAFFGRRWQLIYDIGLGGYGYSVPSNGNTSDLGSGFALMHQLSLDFNFARLRTPVWFFDNSIGLSVFQAWVPSADLGSVKGSGNTFSAMIRYKFGI